MRIIDVDIHFHEPFDWFEKANPTLAAKLLRMTAAEQLIDPTGYLQAVLGGDS